MPAPVHNLFLRLVDYLAIVCALYRVETPLPRLVARSSAFLEQIALESVPDSSPYALGFMRSQLVASACLPVIVGNGFKPKFGQPIVALEFVEPPVALGALLHFAGILPGLALAHALETVRCRTQCSVVERPPKFERFFEKALKGVVDKQRQFNDEGRSSASHGCSRPVTGWRV